MKNIEGAQKISRRLLLWLYSLVFRQKTLWSSITSSPRRWLYMGSSCYPSVLPPNPFIQHYIESLLKDLSLRELYFCVLAISSVYYRLTADLSYFTCVTIKCPTAYLTTTNNVFNELYSRAEANGELVKKFDIFKKIVIRVAIVGRRIYE